MSAYAFSIDSERPARNPDARQIAAAIFNEVRGKALFAQLIGRITGRQNMPSLSNRLAQHVLTGQRSVGMRTVELDRVVGTESRAGDFDSQFNPLNDHSRERWVRIAELRLCAIGLPAVDLLQVGTEYFVRDGHHRISVARALGEAFIEAQVIVIELK